MKRIAVIRVKGSARTRREVEDTLFMLRISRVNYCSIIDDRKTYEGMLKKVKDIVTWGEIDKDDFSSILKNRGELEGRIRLTDDYVKENTKYESIDDFAKAFVDFKAELKDIPNLRPFFRLHPPRKGHGGIKRAVSDGGALGSRDKRGIKGLIIKMR